MRNPFKFIKRIFTKTSQTAAVIIRQFTSGVIWPNRDYENFAKEVYMKNSIAFACIRMIAWAVSSVEWNLYRRKTDGDAELITEDPMVKLLKRSNPKQSWNSFLLYSTSFLALSGNTYIEKASPDTGAMKGVPMELYSLRPDRMTILANEETGLVTGYEYKVGNHTASFEVDPITGQGEILHMKFFHPTDDFYGAAITESSAREIDSSNEATEWNKRLLENEARPGMVFTFEGNLSDDQFDRLEKQLRDEREGSKNAGKSLILEGVEGGKSGVSPYGFSPAELDFIEGNRELARRICISWGVPPQLLGIKGDQTFANYEQARQVFYEDTVHFYLEFFKGELNNWLFDFDSDKYIDFDLDKVPALEPKREKLWDRAEKSNFLTINEKREMVGLEAIEGGDVILVPATMLPLGAEQDQEDEEEEADEEEERAIQKLLDDGYTEEEAYEMVGLGSE